MPVPGAAAPAHGRDPLARQDTIFTQAPVPPDVEENQIFLLDTDYDNYLFFCMENTNAPQQSLMCQCLGMC